jgi:hypothetical protein
LNSYWIKPDFIDLLEASGVNAFFEDGLIRKKKYDKISFNVVDVKSPVIGGEKGVQCGYMLYGTKGETLYDLYHYWYKLSDEPVEEFAENLREMIKGANVTQVSDLIKHTKECQNRADARIETSIGYSSRKISENPYTVLGYRSRFI